MLLCVSLKSASSAPPAGAEPGELFGLRKSTAAARLDCSRWTIDRLIADGELKVFQLRGKPRVRFDSLLAYIERQSRD